MLARMSNPGRQPVIFGPWLALKYAETDQEVMFNIRPVDIFLELSLAIHGMPQNKIEKPFPRYM